MRSVVPREPARGGRDADRRGEAEAQEGAGEVRPAAAGDQETGEEIYKKGKINTMWLLTFHDFMSWTKVIERCFLGLRTNL